MSGPAPERDHYVSESGGESTDDMREGGDERTLLEKRIVEVLAQSEVPMTALEIAQHLQVRDRDRIKEVLEGSLGDDLYSEGVSPPRWSVDRRNDTPGQTVNDDGHMEFWAGIVLDTLEQSPYRLTTKEIAKTISDQTELEIDATAVESILYGPLDGRVESHDDAPVRWSGRNQ